MSTRISSTPILLMMLLLAACHDRSTTAYAGTQPPTDTDADRIACAHGAEPFARACTVDRLQEKDGLVLTVRHPDGAFHRLLVTKDGRGVVAADGAERATVTIDGGDLITVAIGGDRYQLPATVKAKSAAS